VSAPRSLTEVHAELDGLSEAFVAAAEHYVQTRTSEAFAAWTEARRRYTTVHREWWALVSPGVDYDAAFSDAEVTQ
jgi:hypothetical protein